MPTGKPKVCTEAYVYSLGASTDNKLNQAPNSKFTTVLHCPSVGFVPKRMRLSLVVSECNKLA